MKKNLLYNKKIKGSTLFACFLLVVSFLPFQPLKNTTVGQAEENPTSDLVSELSDGNFSFSEGASFTVGEKEPYFNKLRFTLNLENPALENFFDNEKDEAVFSFTLYRKDLRDTDYFDTPLYKVAYMVDRKKAAVETLRMEYKLGYNEESFLQGKSPISVSYSPTASGVSLENEELYNAETYEETQESVSELFGENCKLTGISSRVLNTNKPIIFKEINSNMEFPHLEIEVMLNSPYTNYCVGFDYEYSNFLRTEKYWSWKEFKTLEKDVHEVTEGNIKSSARSIAQTLRNAQESEAFDYIFNDMPNERAEAETIISTSISKEVQIDYLTQIKGTPFAQRVSKTIKVPVYEGIGSTEVKTDDIKSVLGEIACMNSHVERFEHLGDYKFKAIYHKSIWLYAKTADGNRADYFLDINNSYHEQYQRLVDDGIVQEGLYSYVLNEIKKKYPEMVGIPAEDLYGFFGFVSVPDTYTFDSLWNELFDKPTEFKGIVYNFKYGGTLSHAAYTKLLQEYGYGWLETVWNNVWTTLDGKNANHFVFFADPNENEAGISDSGSLNPDDEDGAGKNELDDKNEELKDNLEKNKIIIGIVVFVLVAGSIAIGVSLIYPDLKSLSNKKRKPSKKKKGGKK